MVRRCSSTSEWGGGVKKAKPLRGYSPHAASIVGISRPSRSTLSYFTSPIERTENGILSAQSYSKGPI